MIEADPQQKYTPAEIESGNVDELKTTGDAQVDKWVEQASKGTFDIRNYINPEDHARVEQAMKLPPKEPPPAEELDDVEGFSDTYDGE